MDATLRPDLRALAAERAAKRRDELDLNRRIRARAIDAARAGIPAEQIAQLLEMRPATIEAWIAKASAPRPIRESDARVLAALGGKRLRQRDIVAATGMNQGTVSKVIARLAESGRIERRDDGTLARAA
jgi:DNA-binding transcriptional ArsR family regulator